MQGPETVEWRGRAVQDHPDDTRPLRAKRTGYCQDERGTVSLQQPTRGTDMAQWVDMHDVLKEWEDEATEFFAERADIWADLMKPGF